MLFHSFGTSIVGAFGFALDELGDFDGDGFIDVVVGSPGANRAVVVRAESNQGPGTALCFGSTGGQFCPCGNTNDNSIAAGQVGCQNSASNGGASMKALGSTSIAAATLRFVSEGLVSNTPGL